jgi:predicted nucleic acid-binding protein
MSRLHLDANAMVALADSAGEVWTLAMEQIQAGALPETSAVAWHEFVRRTLPGEERLRIERLLDGRVVAVTRSTAELAAMLFNATGRRRASTADCFIAAAAIEMGAALVTANVADFQRFEEHGLQLLTP